MQNQKQLTMLVRNKLRDEFANILRDYRNLLMDTKQLTAVMTKFILINQIGIQ